MSRRRKLILVAFPLVIAAAAIGAAIAWAVTGAQTFGDRGVRVEAPMPTSGQQTQTLIQVNGFFRISLGCGMPDVDGGVGPGLIVRNLSTGPLWLNGERIISGGSRVFSPVNGMANNPDIFRIGQGNGGTARIATVSAIAHEHDNGATCVGQAEIL